MAQKSLMQLVSSSRKPVEEFGNYRVLYIDAARVPFFAILFGDAVPKLFVAHRPGGTHFRQPPLTRSVNFLSSTLMNQVPP